MLLFSDPHRKLWGDDESSAGLLQTGFRRVSRNKRGQSVSSVILFNTDYITETKWCCTSMMFFYRETWTSAVLQMKVIASVTHECSAWWWHYNNHINKLTPASFLLLGWHKLFCLCLIGAGAGKIEEDEALKNPTSVCIHTETAKCAQTLKLELKLQLKKHCFYTFSM